MGVTISHRGGPVPEAVVDEIIRQLEEAFKHEGWRNITDEPYVKGQNRVRAYWKESRTAEDHDIPDTMSKELGDLEHYLDEYRYRAENTNPNEMGGLDGTTNMKKYFTETYEYYVKRIADLKARIGGRNALFPSDSAQFKNSQVKGICANADPHSETFCVTFTKDDGKDEWWSPYDFTKTQFVRSGPGVHVGFCDFLEDVQRKVKAAGGEFEISDEGEYCDDEIGHKHDVREIVKAVNENAQVLSAVAGQLKDQGWEADQIVGQKTGPQGQYSPGTLDKWLAADLLITAPKRKGLLLLNPRALSAPVL